jgi:hypothetical protein
MELDGIQAAMKLWFAIAYACFAIFTFGHAANNRAFLMELSTFAAMAWPLYWSWEIQRPVSQSDSDSPAKP